MSTATVTAPDTHWCAELRRGNLTYQVCADCSAVVFYPRMLCPTCGSTRLDCAVSTGAGVVYSTTVVHSRSGTHNVALVDVDEGFRMVTSVRGIDPTAVEIGMRVQLAVADDDGRPLALFRPAGGHR